MTRRALSATVVTLLLLPGMARAGNEGRVPGSGGAYSFTTESPTAIEFFDLRYVDGDHFVSDLRFGHFLGPTHLLVAMGGRSRVERVEGGFRFLPWSAASTVTNTVTARCVGTDCAIPIPTVSPDRILMLSGFSFDFGLGNDHQISTVRVMPQLVSGSISEIRVGFGHSSGTLPFDVSVEYITVPSSFFSPYAPSDPRFVSPYRTRSYPSFTWSSPISTSVAGRESGYALLRGFDLRFLGGVQNLLALTVDLRFDRVDVRFTGNAPGQPASAVIDYVLYRPRFL